MGIIDTAVAAVFTFPVAAASRLSVRTTRKGGKSMDIDKKSMTIDFFTFRHVCLLFKNNY
jgi:hypothetical protein